MHASDFIAKRENLCKALHRGIIDTDTFHNQMHALFVEAQVSQGFTSDVHKASEIFGLWVVDR
jgi:hypothetical protein